MTSAHRNRPTIVLGLDMADGGLIQYWARQGRLPHLAAMMAAGARVDLESTAEVLHTSTWPTFATGALPGRHGVYYPYQPTPGHQFARQIDANQYGVDTFWRRADHAGGRCLVYDVPETFPESRFAGCAIFDWGTWAHYGDTAAQPAALLKAVKARFGAYPLGLEAMRLGFAHPGDIAQRLVQSLEYKAATAEWLLRREPWDLAVIGFGETHPAGHYLWPAGATSVEASEEADFARLLAVYAALDAAVGRLLAAMGSGINWVVVSGDGVRANHCGWHLLPGVLSRLGFAAGAGTAPSGQARHTQSSILGRFASIVPKGAKDQVAALLPYRVRNRLSLVAQASALNWAETRAFALPTDLEGCIRINLRGREPQGIVEPGAQYTDLCHELRDALQQLENPVTGQPAVHRVWIRNEIFPGPHQEELPDVIVTWNHDHPITALASSRLGRIDGASPDIRTGTHSMNGFVIVQAPDIAADVGRGQLVDVPATILELAGFSVGAELDGRPLQLTRAVVSS
jgi:predicted AlkP superfamily phosphohydrolase/phosphomutase